MCELTKKCNACLEEKSIKKFKKEHRTGGYATKCNRCQRLKIPVVNDSRLKYYVDENHKKCSKCRIIKNKIEFYESKSGLLGCVSECKNCKTKTDKRVKLRRKNVIKCSFCNKREECKDRPDGKCNVCYKEYLLKNNLKFCSLCKKEVSATGYNKGCTPCRRLKYYSKISKAAPVIEEVQNEHKKCSKCKIEKPFEMFAKDGKKRRSDCKECRGKHRKENFEKEREYAKNSRLRRTSTAKLKERVRCSIAHAFRNNKITKRSLCSEIIDCTFEEFKAHIEKQFLPWMSWDNYGNTCGFNLEYDCSWDLEHIIPVSWANTHEEVAALNHWSNFMPLCSKVNRHEKSNNIYPVCNLELNITVY